MGGRGGGRKGTLGGEVRGRARVYCVSVMGIQVGGRRGRGEEWKGEGGRGKGEGGRGKGEGREWVWLIGVVGMGEDVRLWCKEEGVGGLGAFRGGGMGDGMGCVMCMIKERGSID